MYIGALISLLTATIIGQFSIHVDLLYLCNKTVNNCEFHPKKSIPLNVQWMRSISTAISCFILHFSTFMSVLLLFRSYQLMGVKRQVLLVCCFGYCLHAIYIIALRALEISHSKPSSLQLIPNKVIIGISVCLQIYFLTNHFCIGQTKGSHVSFFLQMTAFPISLVILAAPMADIYNKQNKDGKLLIALFSPLTGVLLKVIPRVSVSGYAPRAFIRDTPTSA